MSTDEKLHILPHFSLEEIASVQAEFERQQQHGRALGDNDSERVRDALQRGKFWTEQIAHLIESNKEDSEEMAHAKEQLSQCREITGI